MNIDFKKTIDKFGKLDWKRLFGRRTEVIGLDVGSAFVKMVQLERVRTGYKVKAASQADPGSRKIRDSEDVNTIRAVRNCVKSADIQSSFAVTGVSGNEVAIRNFRFPSLPKDEVEGAVSLEADQVCPFDANEGSTDYQIISSANGELRGVLAIATNKLIQAKRGLVHNASLESVLIDVDGLALLNCLEQCRPGEQTAGTAVLNVGNNYSNFAMVDEKGMPFVRDIPVAGCKLVENIAANCNTSKEKAGDCLFGDTSGEIHPCLEEAAAELIESINKTLLYYSAEKKSSMVDKVLVCGGFALANGFVEILDKRLNTKAELWNPYADLNYEGKAELRDFLETQGPALAVAGGLAMRSL